MNTAVCGAKARSNAYQPCRLTSMQNGRCRFHGDLSTGPKLLKENYAKKRQERCPAGDMVIMQQRLSMSVATCGDFSEKAKLASLNGVGYRAQGKAQIDSSLKFPYLGVDISYEDECPSGLFQMPEAILGLS